MFALLCAGPMKVRDGKACFIGSSNVFLPLTDDVGSATAGWRQSRPSLTRSFPGHGELLLDTAEINNH